MSISQRGESVLRQALSDHGVANELLTALNNSIGALGADNTFTGNNTFSGNVSLGGAAKTVGFYGSAGVVKSGAFTQTYATADRTHAAPTATALNDNSAGTANTTLEALANGTVYATDVAAIRNNFADLAAAVNALIVDVADVKQLANSIIDDLQAVNLVG